MLLNQSIKFKIVIFLTGLILLLPNFSLAAHQPNHQFPKLSNYFLKWGVSDQEAKELARWDLLIIDMEAQVYTPQNLKKIRQYNPDVKILAYITSQEIRKDAPALDKRTLRSQLYGGIHQQWYLKNSSGQNLNWWPGTLLLNITDQSPGNYGWNDYLPQFVADKILSTGLWDGVFYDNTWPDVSWVSGQIDLNNDQAAEPPLVVDAAWRSGMEKILRETRLLAGPHVLIVGNKGDSYFSHLNGSLIENFPGYGWTEQLGNYQRINFQGVRPAFGIINSNTNNTGHQSDYRRMRFGLCSALLGDGYFSFDFGDQDHAQVWWYDEYSAFLGEPKSTAVNLLENNLTRLKPGLWRREFANGLVLCNSTYDQQVFRLEGEFEKIHGHQDRAHNDGSITEKIVLNPRDGIVLLRPIERIIGSSFKNGSFARVFNSQGQTIRTGFFAYDSQYRGGRNIIIKDINADGQLETVVADDSKVEIYNSQGIKTSIFYPYTERYNLGINISVGDLNGDGTMEIVTGTERGGGPQIRIFNNQGKLINPGFFAYGKDFRGGVNVAIGDLNGDGTSEIIAGAGVGGGPHIRVFNKDGRLINPGFFAYDKGFRGGVNVAVGDIDGDGVAEIIAGSGAGGGPEVRVFNKDGQLLSAGFFAFEPIKKSGVEVIANDLDGDGKAEIIATTTDVFTFSGLSPQGGSAFGGNF
ncbi:MAG TPA: putative glycoside hydrolase [Patescibacteria group bacterium]